MDRKNNLEGRSTLMKNVTEFLDQKSEEQNRLARKKIEIYQNKKTPGRGYEKKEVIPAHMFFLFYVQILQGQDSLLFGFRKICQHR